MKTLKYILTFVSTVLFVSYTVESYAATSTPPREFRAAWIATVANINWPSEKGLPVNTQKSELIELLDMATAMHLNAVVFQVRPAGDALYDSKLEPWSQYLSGTEGQAPEPYYDPLAFAVEECHKRCLEIHAWFNPYRASLNNTTKHAPSHISVTHPEMVHTFGRLLWMEPGDPEVMKHTYDVIMDVVKRYDIDGVHFDDYFYPYDISKNNPFPDQEVYAKYTSNGGTMNLDDWRRDNVNKMVQKVYEGIKKEKPWVKFGISPFGIWQPGYPEGISGLNSYAAIYCDSRKWLQEGWVDYLAPQLYWRITPPKQSYSKLLEWWVKENTKGRDIYAGNNDDKVGYSDTSWSPTEIINQINLTRQLGAQGNIHWSIEPLINDSDGLRDTIVRKCYTGPAIAPAMPWLDKTIPSTPQNVTAIFSNKTTMMVKWDSSVDTGVWRWAIYRKSGKEDWTLLSVIPGTQTSFEDIYSGRSSNKSSYAVSALSRLENESAITEATLQK